MDKTILKLSEDLKNEITKVLSSDGIKSFIQTTKEASDDDSGTFEMVITTESIDRMGEVIKADGWDFTNYMANPIVLWGHDYHMMPVGITTSLEKMDGNKWLAKGKFAPESANPMAQQVRRLYDLGIQRASSVGFIEREREGNLITKAELLEWSFVTVPANPMALSAMKEINISIDEYVTKGLISIEKEEVPPVVTEPVKPEEIKEESTKAFDEIKKEITDVLSEIKKVLIVLEGLSDKKEIPEHKEEEPKIVEEPVTPVGNPEEKALQDFIEKRRIIQSAATILGDVLAEARKGLGLKK